MIKNIKKLILVTTFFLFYSLNSFAENAYFIDFTKVLNGSKSGAEAQKKLKIKFESESQKFNKIAANTYKKYAHTVLYHGGRIVKEKEVSIPKLCK